MKKILIAILAVTFFGCEMSIDERQDWEESREKQADNHINELAEDYRVVVIDSCEYVILTTNDEGYMAHKGNCIYCKKK
jgi:hypothetical protein